MTLNMSVFHHIGGLDVTVLPINEYFFRNIKTYKNDEFFFNRALALFDLEYENYFDNKIAINEYALDVINNKDDYYNYCQKYKNEREFREYLYRYNIDDLLKNKCNMQNEKQKFNNELKELQNKKYRLIDYIKGIPKKDNFRIIELVGDENQEGILEEIKRELYECNSEIKRYEKEKLKLNKLTEALNFSEEKIDVIEKHKKSNIHFVDLTVDQDWEGNYPNTPLIALDRLIKNEEKYKGAIEEINNYKEIAAEYKDYTKEHLKKENQTVNVLEDEDSIEM